MRPFWAFSLFPSWQLATTGTLLTALEAAEPARSCRIFIYKRLAFLED
jgi:hypothetical protein